MLAAPGAGVPLRITYGKADVVHCVLARAPQQPGYACTLGQLTAGASTLWIAAKIHILESH